MNTIHVKPVPERVVDPDLHDFLPKEGRTVVLNDYWQRRINDGDVTVPATPIVTIAGEK